MVGPIAQIGTPGTSHYTVDWSARQRGQEQMWKGIGQLVKSVGEQQRATKEKKSLAELAAFVGDGKQLISEATKRGVPLAKVREMVNVHSMLQPKESDSPFANFYNPTSKERKAARRGSSEAASLAAQGWLTGDPEATTPKERRTAKDRNDVLRYTDDQTPVFPGVEDKPASIGFGDEHKFSTKWTNDSKPFLKGQNAFRGLVAAREQRSATGDMALIYSFLKTQDPNSTVLPGEYASAENTTGIGEGFRRAFNKVVDGQKLTEEQRESFLKTATAQFMGTAQQQERLRQQALANAQRLGINAGALTQYIDKDLLLRFGKTQPQGQPAPTRQGNASDRYANADWRGPPQSAPAQASLMSAPTSRPGPASVRKDLFGTPGLPSGGRGEGDEFGSPFDASGLAPPAAPSPFSTMGRAGLMAVDQNSLSDADLAAYLDALRRETGGR